MNRKWYGNGTFVGHNAVEDTKAPFFSIKKVFSYRIKIIFAFVRMETTMWRRSVQEAIQAFYGWRVELLAQACLLCFIGGFLIRWEELL